MLIFNLSLKNHLKILIIYPYKIAKYKVHEMKFQKNKILMKVIIIRLNYKTNYKILMKVKN